MAVIYPYPGGQVKYLSSTAFELLFGGQAGGGKTKMLVVDALGLQYEQTPLGMPAIAHSNYRGYLFRRTNNRLVNLVDEAHDVYCKYPFKARYIQHRKNEPGSIFEFPSGARIYGCNMEKEVDKYNYQGQQIHFAGFDEVTEFLFTQYIYIFSRCRSPILHLFPRVRCTCNPVGIGLKWVRERFIKNIPYEEMRYWFPDKDPELNPQGIRAPEQDPDALTRVFIPGRLEENLKLKETDPHYKTRIKALGHKYEQALLHGDWDAFQGSFFDKLTRTLHGIEAFEIPDYYETIIGLDYGTTTCAEVLHYDRKMNTAYFGREWTEIGKGTTEKAVSFRKWLLSLPFIISSQTLYTGTDEEKKKKKAMFERKIEITADITIFQVQKETDSKVAPIDAFLEYTKDLNVTFTKVRKVKTETWSFRLACNRKFADMLDWYVNADGIFTTRPHLYFFTAQCNRLFESLFELQADENNPEHIDEDVGERHWYDAGKYALIRAVRGMGTLTDKEAELFTEETARIGESIV